MRGRGILSESALVTGLILAGLVGWLGESLGTPRGVVALLGGGALSFVLYSLLLFWMTARR